MKKLVLFLISMLMVTGMLSGCKKDEPTSSEGDTKKVEGTDATEKKDDTKTSETKTDVSYKKELIMGIEGKIVSIDPQSESNTQHNFVYRMVFDTLIKFNNTTNELEPRLALEWNTEDAITYTFKLRDDVYFHNGEQLKASDVVYSFKRSVDSNSASPLGKMMADVIAEDDFTVKIVLHKANVDLPYMMTLPTSSIINEKACTEDELNGSGIGSGAWKIDSYEFGDYMKLVRNDEYWGEKALTEVFTLRYMSESSPRLIALETGEIDICQNPDTLELSHIEDTPNLELQEYSGSSLNYLALNYKKAPFDNQDFRLALCYGIDTEELIDVVRNGKATKADSLWGWNQYGYNGGTTPYEYDVEKAKEYVNKAYPNGGAKFEISVSSGERKANAEIIQAQMKKIGVEVVIKEYDTAGLSKLTTDGEHEACVYGCGMNIFGDDSRRLICPGTGVNKSHYDNKEVNELMDLAVAELDNEVRMDLYAQVQQILHDDGAYVPLYFSMGFFGVKSGVGGIDYFPTTHHDLSYVYMVE